MKMNKAAKFTFESNEKFYDFADSLRVELSEKGLPKVSQNLNFILHKTAFTTSSELLGEVKLALLDLKENEGERLSEDLLEKVNMCLMTIENAFDKANGKS